MSRSTSRSGRAAAGRNCRLRAPDASTVPSQEPHHAEPPSPPASSSNVRRRTSGARRRQTRPRTGVPGGANSRRRAASRRSACSWCCGKRGQQVRRWLERRWQTRRPPPISRPQRHRADGSGGPLHGHRGLRPGNDHPGPRVPELTASTSRPSESRGPWTNGRHPPPDSDSVTAVPRPRPLARPHGVKLSAAGVEAPRLLRATLRRGQTVRRPRRTVVRSELRLGAVQVSTHRAPGSSS